MFEWVFFFEKAFSLDDLLLVFKLRSITIMMSRKITIPHGYGVLEIVKGPSLFELSVSHTVALANHIQF